jgi:hypothetical protein
MTYAEDLKSLRPVLASRLPSYQIHYNQQFSRTYFWLVPVILPKIGQKLGKHLGAFKARDRMGF